MVEGGRPLEVLEGVRAHYQIVMHGVSLSIGSSESLNRAYSKRCAPPHVVSSRHGFRTTCAGLAWGAAIYMTCCRYLTPRKPSPQVAERIRQVQKILERTILIENVSSYMAFRSSRLEEWEILTAVAEEPDCAILLDINNIFVRAFNHRFDPLRYIELCPSTA